MVEERAHGHFAPFLGFLLAFTFDVLDVLAHIVVVVGLMHQHFQVGGCLPCAIFWGFSRWLPPLTDSAIAKACPKLFYRVMNSMDSARLLWDM